MTKNHPYLTAEAFDELCEVNDIDGALLQYVFGIQSCTTKGEVEELLQEVFYHGKRLSRKDVYERVLGVKREVE